MTIDQKYRPAPEHRRTGGRTAPATISVRTHFMYSEPQPGKAPDAPRHVFCYAASVTDGGEFTDRFEDYNTVASTVGRMVAAFGDDADLEIQVRRRQAGTIDSPHLTQVEADAADARELGRLVSWLRENCAQPRLAGENHVDWVLRLLGGAS